MHEWLGTMSASLTGVCWIQYLLWHNTLMSKVRIFAKIMTLSTNATPVLIQSGFSKSHRYFFILIIYYFCLLILLFLNDNSENCSSNINKQQLKFVRHYYFSGITISLLQELSYLICRISL
jgi:hypothetical protein